MPHRFDAPDSYPVTNITFISKKIIDSVQKRCKKKDAIGIYQMRSCRFSSFGEEMVKMDLSHYSDKIDM